MNRIFFAIILKLFIDLAISDELDEKAITQESKTLSTYTCDEKSYFSKISRINIDYFHVECNAVYQGWNNYTAFATLPNGKDIPLHVIHSSFALRDNNGSEVYSNLGVVRDGKCVGAIIYIYGLSRVIDGDCESSTGVTLVEVPKGYGLFSIRGTCDSTCWGTVTTKYSRGKFNYFDPDIKDVSYAAYDGEEFIDFKRID